MLNTSAHAESDLHAQLDLSSAYAFNGVPVGSSAAADSAGSEQVDGQRPRSSVWQKWWPWIVGGGVVLLVGALAASSASADSTDAEIDPVTPPVPDGGGGGVPVGPNDDVGGTPSNDPPTVNSGIASVDSQDSSGIEASESIQSVKGVFFATAFSQARKRQTEQSRASRQHSHSLLLGYDRLFSSTVNAGVFVDLSTASTTVPESADTNESPSRSLYVFADRQWRASTNVSGYFGVSRHENSQLRYANREFAIDNGSDGGSSGGGNLGPARLTSDSTVNQTLAGVAISQRLPSWRQIQADVSLGMDYSRRKILAYREEGDLDFALAFPQRAEKSLITRLSLTLTRAISTQRGVLVPQLGFEYQNESSDDSRQITANSLSMSGNDVLWQTDVPDRQFGSISAGIVWLAPAGVQIYSDVKTLVQHRFRNSTTVNIGARIEL